MNSNDPYTRGIVPDNMYYKRKSISGFPVAIMSGYIDKRNLKLIKQLTRALRKAEIVELTTTEQTKNDGEIVNNVSYIGFLEVYEGGVVKMGDSVLINGKKVGSILGYDETHMPNHLNLIITMDSRKSGVELNLSLDDEITFIDNEN